MIFMLLHVDTQACALKPLSCPSSVAEWAWTHTSHQHNTKFGFSRKHSRVRKEACVCLGSRRLVYPEEQPWDNDSVLVQCRPLPPPHAGLRPAITPQPQLFNFRMIKVIIAASQPNLHLLGLIWTSTSSPPHSHPHHHHPPKNNAVNPLRNRTGKDGLFTSATSVLHKPTRFWDLASQAGGTQIQSGLCSKHHPLTCLFHLKLKSDANISTAGFLFFFVASMETLEKEAMTHKSCIIHTKWFIWCQSRGSTVLLWSKMNQN